jgi:hypothetical protein
MASAILSSGTSMMGMLRQTRRQCLRNCGSSQRVSRGRTNLVAVQSVAWLRQCYLAALDQRKTDGKFLNTGRRCSRYAARASFHFKGGSSKLPAYLRKISAYVVDVSLPCSIFSTDSDGAIPLFLGIDVINRCLHSLRILL